MYEIEIKAWLENPEEVEEKIKNLNGKKIGEKEIIDTYYDHPKLNLTANKREIRVRKVKAGDVKKSFLTYKEPRKGFDEAKREVELEIPDPKKMKKVLRRLGFIELGIKKKKQRTYELNNTIVDIVYVDRLGFFLEIESKERRDIEKGRKEIYRVFEMLGLERNKIEKRMYLELLGII